ncbi:MAG: pyridoxamine 5'-phosphate oxidase family protein [Ruminococcus sp.]|nr:pyridoxamine 5'-phosphate oxidase family protein [Ruminococcus sp.]
MNEVLEFLKACGTYYLATSENGQPRVRPFGTAHEFEGKLYFQTGKSKKVADQLKAEPRVELCAMAQDGRWIRVTGEAVLDERIEAQESMLEDYPSLRAMYAPGDGNTEVYYLKNASAVISSFTAPPVEYKL